MADVDELPPEPKLPELEVPELAPHERMRAAGSRLHAASLVRGLPPAGRLMLMSLSVSLEVAADDHEHDPCSNASCSPTLLADTLLGREVPRG